MKRLHHPRRHLPATLAGLGVAALVTTVITAAPAVSAAPSPKPVTTAAPTPKEPVPAGFSTWAEVYAFQSRLNTAAEAVVAADANENASIVADPVTRKLQVYWKGTVPAAVREISRTAGVPVSIKAAPFSRAELLKQARDLADEPAVADVAPAADGSGLAVTVADTLRSTTRTDLNARSRVPLKIKVGAVPQALAGRQADTQNYWGGSRFSSAVGRCTNGFPIRFGGTFHMITAGHCGENGGGVDIPGQASPTGTIFSKSACRDTEIINYNGALQPRVYTGPFDSSTSVETLGATSDFVGNLVVTSGSSSGEHLNVRVDAVDVFTGITGIACTTVGPLTRAVGATTSTCVAAPGDSGGPVYAYVGTNVSARGTISAATLGTATCPGLNSNGGSTVWYAPLFRPARDSQIGSLDFYRAVPSTVTTINLNGRWTDGGTRNPIITMNDTNLTINMSAFGRPNATGAVSDASSRISVTFPDAGTFTGQLVAPNRIQWSNGTTWTKVAESTIFDLGGRWTGGNGPGPFFTVTGTSLSIDMSAFGRPTATGTVTSSSTISVTFPDGGTFTGQLVAPNRIAWSNGTFWLKL